jgi:transcriptional regulator with XRE-family HTH domain
MLTPVQCRMARAALQIGVRDLAKMAGVSPMTVTRFENGQSGGHADTLRKLQRALEEAGLEFIPENGGGPGVRMREAVPSSPVEKEGT